VIHRGPEGHGLEFARHSPLLLNARRAASPQAAFPSRRAREKAVPEKDIGMMRTQARQQEQGASFKETCLPACTIYATE
jgi:hypothetical protein